MRKYFWPSAVLLFIFGVSISYGAEGYEYIPDDHTLALWHMDEGQGDDVADSSPSGFDAITEGSSDWGDEGWKLDGTPGSSFTFNGTTLLNVGNIKEIINPGAITVEAWVYPADLGGWKLICCNWGGADVGAYHLGCENGIPKFHITTGTGTAFAGAAGSLETEQWQHIAGTYDEDSGEIQIYVDGEVAGTTDHSGDLIDNDMDVTIGSKHSREFHWNGFIDEVRISDIVRASDELSVNQTQPFSVSPIDNLATTWGIVKTK